MFRIRDKNVLKKKKRKKKNLQKQTKNPLATTNTSHKYSIFHVEVAAIPRGKMLIGTQPPPVLPRQGGCSQPAVTKLPQPHFPQRKLGSASPKLPRHIYVSHQGCFQSQGIETRTYKEHLNLYLRKKKVLEEFNFFFPGNIQPKCSQLQLLYLAL